MAKLPDLTTPEGAAVASDMLLERGWPRAELRLTGLFGLCTEARLGALASVYAQAAGALIRDPTAADFRRDVLAAVRQATRASDVSRALTRLADGPDWGDSGDGVHHAVLAGIAALGYVQGGDGVESLTALRRAREAAAYAMIAYRYLHSRRPDVAAAYHWALRLTVAHLLDVGPDA